MQSKLEVAHNHTAKAQRALSPHKQLFVQLPSHTHSLLTALLFKSLVLVSLTFSSCVVSDRRKASWTWDEEDLQHNRDTAEVSQGLSDDETGHRALDNKQHDDPCLMRIKRKRLLLVSVQQGHSAVSETEEGPDKKHSSANCQTKAEWWCLQRPSYIKKSYTTQFNSLHI